MCVRRILRTLRGFDVWSPPKERNATAGMLVVFAVVTLSAFFGTALYQLLTDEAITLEDRIMYVSHNKPHQAIHVGCNAPTKCWLIDNIGENSTRVSPTGIRIALSVRATNTPRGASQRGSLLVVATNKTRGPSDVWYTEVRPHHLHTRVPSYFPLVRPKSIVSVEFEAIDDLTACPPDTIDNMHACTVTTWITRKKNGLMQRYVPPYVFMATTLNGTASEYHRYVGVFDLSSARTRTRVKRISAHTIVGTVALLGGVSGFVVSVGRITVWMINKVFRIEREANEKKMNRMMSLEFMG